MFSGIVEAKAPIIEAQSFQDTVRICVEKPVSFDDLSLGDSISTNGVCLTVESFDEKSMSFVLGRETLEVTGWSEESLNGQEVNLERSLRVGDRVHGHWVSGHVDTMGQVKSVDKGESWVVEVSVTDFDPKLAWQKGSLTINGVSLTINKIVANVLSVCLIPETLERTNLKLLSSGDNVTIEYDTWAKAVVNYQEQSVNL